MITNTEDNDLYITDKVDQIRLGKQLKRKDSGVEVKHFVYTGKQFVLTGKETKDAFDETTVKKRDRNYVLFESKLGTEKRVDIIGFENKKPKKEQKPYQKPQLKINRPTKLGVEKKVTTSNIERGSKTNQYQNQKPQLKPIFSYGLGGKGSTSYLEKSDSKPQYQYPQLKSSISYNRLIEDNGKNSYLEKLNSKPNQYHNQYPQLKSSTSYKLGIGLNSESSYLENSGSLNQYPTLTPSYSFRLGTGLKTDIANIGKVNSNQYHKLIQKPEPKQRSIRTPAPRRLEKIFSHSKKKDYLDNYQYLETQTVRNPRKKSYVKHIRFGDIIGSPSKSNTNQTLYSFYEPKAYKPQYNELTYNPKMAAQKTVITTTINKPQLISSQLDNNNIKRITRIGPRTPAVKTIDINSFMNSKNSITTTNWKPSDDFRKKKPETFGQTMLRKDISQPYETRTEIRQKVITNSGIRNQPNNEVERIRVNRHRYQPSSGMVISNEPRIDNLSTLNFANSITTSSRMSRRNIKIPSFPISPSINLYNNSSSKPDTKIISKVEILKSDITNIPNVERKQISDIAFDTNYRKRNSIRAQYKKRK